MANAWKMIERVRTALKGDTRTDEQKIPPPALIFDHIRTAYAFLLQQQTLQYFREFGRSPNTLKLLYDPLLFKDDEYTIVTRDDGRRTVELPAYDMTLPYAVGAQYIYFIGYDGCMVEIPIVMFSQLQFACKVPYASVRAAMIGRTVHFVGNGMGLVDKVRIVIINTSFALDPTQPDFMNFEIPLKADLEDSVVLKVINDLTPQTRIPEDTSNDQIDNALMTQ